MKAKKIKDIPSVILEEKTIGTNLMADIRNLSVEDLIVVYAYAEAIVETVREPLIILDKNLNIKSANKAFFETFQVSKRETYNKSIFALGNGQWNISDLKKLLLDVLPKDELLFDYEVRHKFEDIGEKIMLLNARRMILEGQNTHLILLAIEDVTEKRKIEQQKDDFIEVVSHELKTPTTSIKLYAELLKMHLIEMADEKSIDMIEAIEVQVGRLTEMMTSFTNVYRLQTSSLELKTVSIDVNKMVNGVIKTLKLITQTHSIKLLGTIRKKLVADKDRIEQVLINLISNAIKYSPDAKKVVVKIMKDKKNLLISVQDFGMGIPKDQQSKIYNRFYRIKGASDKKIEGLGLGLYISNQIVKDHGGEIRLKSTKNKGSTFTLVLPFNPDKKVLSQRVA